MRRDLFQPTAEGEARLLLLIAAFTTAKKSLEGRTKLAKLDFLLRYPYFLKRALVIQAPGEGAMDFEVDETIETRMLRYRYGPWDPAYFAVLGSLIGRGLVVPVATGAGIGYRATPSGRILAQKLASTESWNEVARSARLLKSHFDKSGA